MQPIVPEHSSARIDSLTGIGNLLSFAEQLLDPRQSSIACSLLVLDLNGLRRLDHQHGNNVLRWIALVLREELADPVYRIGSDEFAAILPGVDHHEHHRIVDHLTQRLKHESRQFGLSDPAVTTSVIHYRHAQPRSPSTVLGHIQTAINQAKAQIEAQPSFFVADTLPLVSDLRELVDVLVQRMVGLGAQLEESQHLAFSDPVTDLPNVRAAMERLRQTLQQAYDRGLAFAVVMIDGDNLRRYNDIGYAAGDRMLVDLSGILNKELRPSDFLARWRIGDEFLVILPDTDVAGARVLAERLRRTIERDSREWTFPITISLGIAAYPQHGETIEILLQKAETAKDQAKSSGKNQVRDADEV
jgi:diguanylate cyclase (GGDEF)-like protein